MTKEMWKNEPNRVGVFNTIVNFVAQGHLSKADAAKGLAHTFGFYGEKVQESKSEVRRIDAVLNRLSTLCATGTRVVPWNGKGPLVDQLSFEVRALDGWVMSLYETDLTMIRLGAPELGRTRAMDMARSMDTLWEKRMEAYNLRLKDTGAFKLLF